MMPKNVDQAYKSAPHRALVQNDKIKIRHPKNRLNAT